MRQQVYIRQHFRRGNALSHPDCRAIQKRLCALRWRYNTSELRTSERPHCAPKELCPS